MSDGHPRSRRLMLCAAIIVFSLLPDTSAAATKCEDAPVIITASDIKSAKAICEAAGATLAFLGNFQLKPQRPIAITVVDNPLQSEGHPIYGSFDHNSGQVKVMSVEAIALQQPAPTLYRLPFETQFYASVVAHEIAHAVAQQNSTLERISNAAHEYLAHAAQMAALPEQTRLQIIAEANVGPWVKDDIISEVYMAFAPERFAAKCYLHLTAHQSPATFVQHLLNHKWRYVTVTRANTQPLSLTAHPPAG